eukprot:m51a1_g4283 putative glycerol dehydrogenase (155) ;mRNA; r:356512-370668
MAMKTTTRVTTTLFPGKYIQGAGALGRLPGLVAEHGGRALVVCAGPPVDRIVEARVRPLFAGAGSAGAGEVRFEQFAGEVTRAEIERLRGVCSGSGASVVVGIGGGKTIDAAKVVAEINGLDLVPLEPHVLKWFLFDEIQCCPTHMVEVQAISN